MNFYIKPIGLIFFILLLSGCGVSSFKAQNWNINHSSDLSSELYRTKNLDQCRQQAQQPKVKQNPSENSSHSYESIDRASLITCMEQKGYKLRDLTDFEEFMNILASPVVFPFLVFGKNFDDTY